MYSFAVAAFKCMRIRRSMTRKKQKIINNAKTKRHKDNKNSKLKPILRTIGITLLTVLLTKALDSLFPSKISFVDAPAKTVNIEHSFDFGPSLSDSVLNSKLINLARIEELENKYTIQSDNSPNEIISNTLCPNAQGYLQRNSMAYCSVDIVNSNDKTMDCLLSFFNQSIVDEVSFVGVKVCRIDSDGKKLFVADCNYKPRAKNLMRLTNNFPPGRYSFEIGFTFKKDISKKYPDFYYQTIYYRF